MVRIGWESWKCRQAKEQPNKEKCWIESTFEKWNFHLGFDLDRLVLKIFRLDSFLSGNFALFLPQLSSAAWRREKEAEKNHKICISILLTSALLLCAYLRVLSLETRVRIQISMAINNFGWMMLRILRSAPPTSIQPAFYFVTLSYWNVRFICYKSTLFHVYTLLSHPKSRREAFVSDVMRWLSAMMSYRLFLSVNFQGGFFLFSIIWVFLVWIYEWSPLNIIFNFLWFILQLNL